MAERAKQLGIGLAYFAQLSQPADCVWAGDLNWIASSVRPHVLPSGCWSYSRQAADCVAMQRVLLPMHDARHRVPNGLHA
jgi:hypothetical protein